MSALLEVDRLEVSFGGRTAAVRGASLTVERGETHCLVGESGCGKSVTALAVMDLLARGARRQAGRLAFEGQDLQGLSDAGMAHLRGNQMAMIFQEPMTSLNPAYTVGSQMTEVLRRHRHASQRVATAEIPPVRRWPSRSASIRASTSGESAAKRTTTKRAPSRKPT